MQSFFDFQGDRVSITVCYKEAIVLYQNAQSVNIFGNVVGNSLYDYHPPKATEKIRQLLRDKDTNVYTISKKGLKKIIYQTPWYDEQGELQGLIEYSMVIPEEMVHHQRD